MSYYYKVVHLLDARSKDGHLASLYNSYYFSTAE